MSPLFRGGAFKNEWVSVKVTVVNEKGWVSPPFRGGGCQ